MTEPQDEIQALRAMLQKAIAELEWLTDALRPLVPYVDPGVYHRGEYDEGGYGNDPRHDIGNVLVKAGLLPPKGPEHDG